MMKLVLRAMISLPHFRGKSALAKLLGLASGPIWLRSKYGPWFRFYPADSTSAYAVVGGGYDDVVGELGRLKRGMNFVDIGANAGIMSLIASARIGPEGRCYAFEPNPMILARLAENIAKNSADNIRVVPFAVSDRTDFLPMRFNVQHTGQAHVCPEHSKDSHVLAVDLRQALPGLWAEICSRPFLVKIDVEGHEAYALRSIESILKSNNCVGVVVEIERDFLERAGSKVDDIFSIMASHGFSAVTGERGKDHYNQVFER